MRREARGNKQNGEVFFAAEECRLSSAGGGGRRRRQCTETVMAALAW